MFLFAILSSINCTQPTEPDTTPPTIVIAYPIDGSSVSEVVKVTAVVSDNNGRLDSIYDQLTVEAWIYLKSKPNTNWRPRIIDRSDNYNDDRIVLNIDGNSVNLNFNINKNKVKSERLDLNKWVQINYPFDN